MSEVKHTPTPWVLNPKSLDIAGWGGEEVLINEGHGYGFVGALDDANAAFIVLAVNNHDALVAACEAMLPVVANAIMHGMPVTKEVANARNLAVTALSSIAKAKGGA